MKIVIFHYHLNPGGVTSIIQSQIKAIQLVLPKASISIITGNCPNKNFAKENRVEVIENSLFNYLDKNEKQFKAKFPKILESLQKSVKQADILHFHNPNLGKNPLITLAVSVLAEKGLKILNHTHDFAEDRKENLAFLKEVIEGSFNKKLFEIMYPTISNYSIACLTSFDINRIKSYSFDSERTYLLPNPVGFYSESTPGKFNKKNIRKEIEEKLAVDPSKIIVTYPVRVIKRKNIGEYILLSVIFKDMANFVVTQPPKNPKEIQDYNSWIKFCETEGINIFWEAGNRVNFEKLIIASDYCVTTSIQEGFGMVFLEPWIYGTSVIGRNIPSVTTDLQTAGIEFPLLYNKLIVDKQKEMHELSMEEQMQIIRKCYKSDIYRTELFRKNTFLKDFFIPENQRLINKNKAVILKEFSLEKYGNRLHEIYRRITERP